MRQVVLHPGEDGMWVAEVPSLPGCISQGMTKEEALHNVRDAIEAWIDATTELGQDIPAESFATQVCIVG